MGDPKTRQADAFQEMEAFHRSLVQFLEATGALAREIPRREWEALLARARLALSRQTANDKTWAMESLGLIQVLEAHPGGNGAAGRPATRIKVLVPT